MVNGEIQNTLKKEKIFKIGDIFILIIILSILSFFLINILSFKKEEISKKAEIYVDGKLKYVYDLDKNLITNIPTEIGGVDIEIKS